MASRISQLTALTGANTASGDLLPIVDVSDTSMAASGTDKKITLTELQSAPVSAGTANGILYLNGSKVPTAGSALTFDGTLLSAVTAGALKNSIQAWYGSGNNASIAFGVHNANGDGYLGFNTSQSTGDTQNYFASTAAAKLRYTNGAFQFHIAPSGTAGNAISFTQAMTLDASGRLLVGTTSSEGTARLSFLETAPTKACLSLRQQAGGGETYIRFLNSNNTAAIGSIVNSADTGVSYNTTSDYRLKDNQAPLTDSGAFIDALKPKTWNWKADGTKGVGFIAHEVQEISPTSVVGEKDATRVEQYEVSPAVPATYDEQGNELTPAVEAVMGEREVPAYQAMEYGSAEFIANIVAELQSLRKRVTALEAGVI